MEHDKAVDVTVVMPVYNGAAYLAPAIESVLAQQGVGCMEVLVFDDGSTDQSPDILARYHDPRLRVARHPNKGLAATLNIGLRFARGRYIARQDHDDIVLPGRLAKQVAFLDANPDVAMVGTWAEIRVLDRADGRYHRHPTAPDALRLRLLFDNPFVHSSLMMRAHVVRTLGGYSEDKSRQPPEDYELWSRIAREHAVANLPDVLTIYREIPASMSRTGENPFLRKVLNISAENLHALIGDRFDFAACLQLASLYHHADVGPILIRRGEAMQMIRLAIDRICSGQSICSAEFHAESSRLTRHIEYCFLRRLIPSPVLVMARRMRMALQQRGDS